MSPRRPALASPGIAPLFQALSLAELEAAACFGAAVLLALDGAAVAGQETGALYLRAQDRLVLGQRLRNAVLARAGLARQPAALDGADDVVLALALGDAAHLADHAPQRRSREIHFLVAAIDRDLAAARLEPDARDRVLAATGRIGVALRVDFLLAQQSRRRSRAAVAGVALRHDGIR